MKFYVLIFALLTAPAWAQTPTLALPTSADVMVIPSTGDPITIAPIATRNTLVSPALCNLTPSPAGALSPLINPTGAEVSDPFLPPSSGRVCRLAMPVGVPNGTGYRAVAVFNADCSGVPCSSPRSLVGIPPFDIVGTRVPPAAPTTPAVRP